MFLSLAPCKAGVDRPNPFQGGRMTTCHAVDEALRHRLQLLCGDEIHHVNATKSPKVLGNARPKLRHLSTKLKQHQATHAQSFWSNSPSPPPHFQKCYCCCPSQAATILLHMADYVNSRLAVIVVFDSPCFVHMHHMHHLHPFLEGRPRLFWCIHSSKDNQYSKSFHWWFISTKYIEVNPILALMVFIWACPKASANRLDGITWICRTFAHDHSGFRATKALRIVFHNLDLIWYNII